MSVICNIFQASGTSIGFTSEDVSARYLRAGRAMALFMELVDTDNIRLMGRLRIDTMLLYLHNMYKSFTDSPNVRMLQYSDYAIITPVPFWRLIPRGADRHRHAHLKGASGGML